MAETRDRPRGIVFDLDGTLIDSYPAIAASVDAARSAFGMAPCDPAELRRHVGRGLESLIADLVGPDRVAEGVRRFRETYGRVWPDGTSLLPGAAVAVATLRAADVRLAVASNKPARFGRAILERLGLAGAFVAVEGPDTAGRAKPDPAMLSRCLAALGTAPRDTLYVGDMPLDVESGRRAGLPVALVEGGSASRAELLATGRPVLAGVAGLPARLDGLLGQAPRDSS